MIAGRRNAGDGLAIMATQYTMLSGTMQCRAVMQIRMRTYSTEESPIILERLGTSTVAQFWSLFPYEQRGEWTILFGSVELFDVFGEKKRTFSPTRLTDDIIFMCAREVRNQADACGGLSSDVHMHSGYVESPTSKLRKAAGLLSGTTSLDAGSMSFSGSSDDFGPRDLQHVSFRMIDLDLGKIVGVSLSVPTA